MVGKVAQQRRGQELQGGGSLLELVPDTRDPQSPSIMGLPGKAKQRLSSVDVDGAKGVQGLEKMKAGASWVWMSVREGVGRGQADRMNNTCLPA